MGSAGFPPPSLFIRSSTLESLGSRPTKQLASMGILPCSHQDPIALYPSRVSHSSSISSSPSLSTADPSREAAADQSTFSLVVWLSWCLVEASVLPPLMYEVRESEQRRQLGVESDISSAAKQSPGLLLLPGHAHCRMQGKRVRCRFCTLCSQCVIRPVTVRTDFNCQWRKTKINVVQRANHLLYFLMTKLDFEHSEEKSQNCQCFVFVKLFCLKCNNVSMFKKKTKIEDKKMFSQLLKWLSNKHLKQKICIKFFHAPLLNGFIIITTTWTLSVIFF